MAALFNTKCGGLVLGIDNIFWNRYPYNYHEP